MTSLADAALAYAAGGIPVFPVHGIPPTGFCTCGRSPDWHESRKRKPGKHPATENGLKDASLAADQVRAWWRKQPLYNIGLIPGRASGFWVLDLDGPQAEAAIGALEAVHGSLPATPEQVTGKGRHLLFAWPESESGDGAIEIRNSASKIGPGVDVRGEGGYIVAAPSMHANGNRYAWALGRGLLDLPFAAAPDWLIQLAAPPKPAPAPRPAAPARRRVFDGSSATPYGEAAIANQCRRVQTAPSGRQNDTLWLAAISLGQLCGGGEIHDLGYAMNALRDAGRDMVASAGQHWTDREEDTLKRGFDVGIGDPRSAPDRQARSPARSGEIRRERTTPAEAAEVLVGARGLWEAARPAGCWPVFDWMTARGLAPNGIAGALDRLRVHARAPLPDGPGPALLAPLRASADAPVDGLALLALDGHSERFCRIVGDSEGRAIVLAPPTSSLVVAIDLQDAWRLGSVMLAHGGACGVVVTPTLKTFAGAPLGDAYGRISLDAPMADPATPPWTCDGADEVIIALRRDLRSPEYRVRKMGGGTRRVRLEGEAAARFYGALAEQAWGRRARSTDSAGGANAVRLLWPANGAISFSSSVREAV